MFRFGRYYFDGNPFIGRMTGISAWDTVLTEEQMRVRTSCSAVSLEPGSLLSASTSWTLTAALVTTEEVDENELECGKYSKVVTAHLPIPQLSQQEAQELCSKLGTGVHIAGEILSEQDFREYYDGVMRNDWYRSECGYFDNGRLKTWLPYEINATGSGLSHSLTGTALYGPYYMDFYPGPSGPDPGQCGAAYFGLVPYQRNVQTDRCTAKKCVACALPASHRHTASVILRGLCRYSVIDTTYQVEVWIVSMTYRTPRSTTAPPWASPTVVSSAPPSPSPGAWVSGRSGTCPTPLCWLSARPPSVAWPSAAAPGG